MVKLIDISVIIRNCSKFDGCGDFIEQLKHFFNTEQIRGEIIPLTDTEQNEYSTHKKIVKTLPQSVDNKASELLNAINFSTGKYIIIIDQRTDNSISIVKKFYNELLVGYHLIIANKENDNVKNNSYLSRLSMKMEKLFISSNVHDFFATNRAFSRNALIQMDLQTKGYEFLSEMVIKAKLLKMQIRILNILSDNIDIQIDRKRVNFFQYFFYLLLYSPRWLFFYPGLIILVLGVSTDLFVLIIRDTHLDIHTMLFAASMIIVGFQMVLFSVYSKLFALQEKLIPKNAFLDNILKKFTLEKGIFIGGILLLFGLLIGLYNFLIWEEGTFFDLGLRITFSNTIQSIILIVIGFNMIISSFFLNFLAINRKKE